MSITLTDSAYAPFAGKKINEALAFAADFSRSGGRTPATGSQADNEINYNSEDGPRGPWPSEAARRPYDIAGGLMIVAISHFLRSLSLLLVEDMALYGFQAVTRSAVEAVARVVWVLDSGIDIRQRVVRSTLLELESIYENKKTESASGGDGSWFNAKIVELRTTTALLGLDEKLSNNNRVVGFDGQTLPSKTDAVAQLMPHLGLTHGRLWYSQLSGVTHSVLYGITEYLTPGEADGSGRTVPVATLPIQAVANASLLAVDGYLLAVERYALLWGRDASVVAGKRLEIKGELLSAVNRPELRKGL